MEFNIVSIAVWYIIMMIIFILAFLVWATITHSAAFGVCDIEEDDDWSDKLIGSTMLGSIWPITLLVLLYISIKK